MEPSITRPPSIILKELDELQKELHEVASVNAKFRKFIYHSGRYPFRTLGFVSAPQAILDSLKEWKASKGA